MELSEATVLDFTEKRNFKNYFKYQPMKKLILPVLVAFVLAACGGSKAGDPAGVAEKFSKAMYDQDIEEAKKYASSESAQMLDMIGGMMSMMPDSVKSEREPFFFKVAKDSVADDRAWIWPETADGQVGEAIELVKVEGEWKVVFSKN